MRTKRLCEILVGGLLVVLLLVSCGGGGGGGGGSSSPSWNGPVNAAGFPDVDGKYSFNTGNISYTCTDGTKGTVSAVALNFEISQNANQLLFYNPAASLIPGITIIESNNLTGNIEKTGYFIANQRVVAIINPLLGTNTINYNLSGYFNLTGWNGNYEYVGYNDYYNVSCTNNSTFTGDYIRPLAIITPARNNPHEEVVEKVTLEGNLNDIRFILGLPWK